MMQIAHDPHSHLFYDVEWSAWLEERNLQVTDILSFTWVVPANITLTDQEDIGTLARVYLSGLTLGERAKITCRISVTSPAGGDPLQADYSFELVGKNL